MKVSIVKCDSYEQKKVDKAVKESLMLIGFKFKKNIKVLLKPNLAGPAQPEKAITTHPSVLIALCNILKKEDAKVYIGDSPAYPNVKKVFKVSGMEYVAKKCGAKLLNFNSSNKVRLENPYNKVLKTVDLPEIVKKVDLIINVPKLKTHVFTKYSGAVKNLYGLIIGGKKNYYHLITRTEEKFAEMLLDLHSFVKPQLTVMDAIVGMEGSGPARGTPRQTGLIIASTDCTSLDIIASELIGFEPRSIKTILESEKRGYREKIEKVGFLKDYKVVYKLPFRLHLKFLPRFISEMVYKPVISVNLQKCKKCLVCYKQCPARAIEMKKGILRVNLKKCIQCYCCYEICTSHAIDIKYSFIITYGRKLLELSQ